jgi:spore coat polysaccharide biosynthesis protein SpsF
MLPLAGIPVIRHVLDRVARVSGIDQIVLATTTSSRDDELAAYVADGVGIPVYRGDEHDVLARFAGALRTTAADAVVRLTADCPLLCPSVSARVVDAFRTRSPQCDYVSNTMTRTFPRGLDTEVLTTAALFTADEEARDAYEREHVTPFIWRRPDRFRLCHMEDEVDRSENRWTLDTQEDFALISAIYDDLYPVNAQFDYDEILSCLTRHPDWASLNRHVTQKGGERA